MTETVLLRDLSVVMAVAAATTWICHWLKQPVVLGYLLAGLVIGPHTPPFSLIKDLHSIHTMAELGLVFLMFALGLEFSLPQLRRVGPRAALATVLEIVGMLWIGYELGQVFGWSRLNSIFLGAILSISSTTIIVKTFMDLKITKEEFAQIVFGILVLEDIAAVALLTVLSGLSAGAGLGAATMVQSFIKIGGFVIIFLVAGLAIVPWLIKKVASFNSKETLGITTLGLCLGASLIAYKFGFSVALGAFLMGAVLGVSSELEAIEEWMHSVRDMFSAIFFVAAGLSIDVGILKDYAAPVLIITAVTIAGKIFTGTAGTLLSGCSLPTSLKAGMSLAQIGEFSFVFAGLALTTKGAGDFLFPIAVAVSALTTLWTPFGIRSADAFTGFITRHMPKKMLHALNRYQTWASSSSSVETAATIYSRYLVRLVVYATILTVAWRISYRMAYVLESGPMAWLLWSAAFLMLLPLILAVSYYVNHFFLLALTELMVRARASSLLSKIPIHKVYNTFEVLLIGTLSLLFFSGAYSQAADKRIGLALAVGVPLLAFLFRRTFRRGYIRLEVFVDQLMGLATSEPLRPAALQKEGPEGVLRESMERIMITADSPMVHKTIRALGLREKTGTNLIAIYRRGKMLTSPGPDTTLLTNDILVVIGEEHERAQARALLKP